MASLLLHDKRCVRRHQRSLPFAKQARQHRYPHRLAQWRDFFLTWRKRPGGISVNESKVGVRKQKLQCMFVMGSNFVHLLSRLLVRQWYVYAFLKATAKGFIQVPRTVRGGHDNNTRIGCVSDSRFDAIHLLEKDTMRLSVRCDCAINHHMLH